ncbi:hypothetical protein A5821_002918 [Enterococcus sp. 7F3_DIV0205]|uniref:Toxin-antitoxin system antitoxin subunit n=1 Tax=Candidatus Enterococcus palustris TaxID=1834189 RepID=A0AAQ3Y8B9_9ENTE|nr:DUF6290 family protein [Enterococcus sp. 7F3_DIV0205]OTN83352.1 hypothetical protein A5821_003275 [Enterococcus sp. 7F3_DIV0205]
MSTVTFRLSEDEKEFMQKMADFNGLSLSELARTKILENLEDQIDMDTYNKLMKEHRIKDESISHVEMVKKLGL